MTNARFQLHLFKENPISFSAGTIGGESAVFLDYRPFNLDVLIIPIDSDT